ncbi:MAG: hypothetical protein EZS28_008560 [Streblomastix strix]|uniref:Uncharacterized protein n=1 Tax=Streblomastix strix TaxID=222440 RepID=A0A5J4WM54_9EUKA|nr:MAG: hypothetical protein EZS28_008557 [Streblomastix strix]KAA6395916.1 MAG: hypothetical protein EZS28_008560 [Streblomastix strix]
MVYGPTTASALVAFTVPDWDLLLDKEREGVEEYTIKQDKVIEWGNGAVKLFWEEGKVDLMKRKKKKRSQNLIRRKIIRKRS